MDTENKKLINKSIGICKCITEANKIGVSSNIIKMYAEESGRIDKQYLDTK